MMTESLGDYVSECSVIIDTFRIKCHLQEVWNRIHPIMGKYLSNYFQM